MFKIVCFTFFASFVSFCSLAQETSDEYQLRANEKLGWIIDKEGNKIEGIVKLTGSKDTPWLNQQSVKFIANADINLEKKNQKLKSMDAGDIKGYGAYDGEVLREFELINYTNLRESSKSDGGGIGGKIKLIKNLSKSNYIAEVIINGSIKVFRLYGIPSSVAVGNKEIKEMEADIENIKNNPTILVSKKGGKLEELNSDDFKKLTEDCEVVRTKMLNKEYPSYNPEKEEKKRSKLGALMKNEMELNGSKIQKMAFEILPDYNENCGK